MLAAYSVVFVHGPAFGGLAEVDDYSCDTIGRTARLLADLVKWRSCAPCQTCPKGRQELSGHN